MTLLLSIIITILCVGHVAGIVWVVKLRKDVHHWNTQAVSMELERDDINHARQTEIRKHRYADKHLKKLQTIVRLSKYINERMPMEARARYDFDSDGGVIEMIRVVPEYIVPRNYKKPTTVDRDLAHSEIRPGGSPLFWNFDNVEFVSRSHFEQLLGRQKESKHAVGRSTG